MQTLITVHASFFFYLPAVITHCGGTIAKGVTALETPPIKGVVRRLPTLIGVPLIILVTNAGPAVVCAVVVFKTAKTLLRFLQCCHGARWRRVGQGIQEG